jgi:hypothetical protein
MDSNILKISKDKRCPFMYTAYQPEKNLGETLAFTIHEDNLRDLVSEDAFVRMEDGEEIEFRMEEVTDGS